MSGAADREILRCVALDIHRGGRRILGPLDLALSSGQSVAVRGPNGAGKSSLLQAIAGLIPLAGGSVSIEGHRLGSGVSFRVRAYVPQYPVVYEDLSLRDQLAHVAALHGVPKPGAAADDVIAELQLEDIAGSVPSIMAAGHRRACAIALALVRPSSLLIADEPFNDLDESRRAAAVATFERRRREGSALLLALHEIPSGLDVTRSFELQGGTSDPTSRPAG